MPRIPTFTSVVLDRSSRDVMRAMQRFSASAAHGVLVLDGEQTAEHPGLDEQLNGTALAVMM